MSRWVGKEERGRNFGSKLSAVRSMESIRSETKAKGGRERNRERKREREIVTRAE